MKIATWNVNSVRARLERLLAWLRKMGFQTNLAMQVANVQEVPAFVRLAKKHGATCVKFALPGLTWRSEAQCAAANVAWSDHSLHEELCEVLDSPELSDPIVEAGCAHEFELLHSCEFQQGACVRAGVRPPPNEGRQLGGRGAQPSTHRRHGHKSARARADAEGVSVRLRGIGVEAVEWLHLGLQTSDPESPHVAEVGVVPP